MEIVFLLISIILSIGIAYILGRTVYSHSQLIRAYKRDELLLQFHLFCIVMLLLIFFVTLCAFNNTFWHLPYLKSK